MKYCVAKKHFTQGREEDRRHKGKTKTVPIRKYWWSLPKGHGRPARDHAQDKRAVFTPREYQLVVVRHFDVRQAFSLSNPDDKLKFVGH